MFPPRSESKVTEERLGKGLRYLCEGPASHAAVQGSVQRRQGRRQECRGGSSCPPGLQLIGLNEKKT